MDPSRQLDKLLDKTCYLSTHKPFFMQDAGQVMNGVYLVKGITENRCNKIETPEIDAILIKFLDENASQFSEGDLLKLTDLKRRVQQLGLVEDGDQPGLINTINNTWDTVVAKILKPDFDEPVVISSSPTNESGFVDSLEEEFVHIGETDLEPSFSERVHIDQPELATANSLWLLGLEPDEAQAKALGKFLDQVISKAKSEQPLTQNEWDGAARACVVLLRRPNHEHFKQIGEELLLRHAIVHGVHQELSPEFYKLFQFVGGSLDKKLKIYQQLIRSGACSGEDVNGSHGLGLTERVFARITRPNELVGFEVGNLDSNSMVKSLKELSSDKKLSEKIDNADEMKKLVLVTVWLMQKRVFEQEHVANFKLLAEQIKLIGSRIEVDPRLEEQPALQNLMQVYDLFKATHFEKRVGETGGQVWRDLDRTIGGTASKFTPKDLLEHLNAIKHKFYTSKGENAVTFKSTPFRPIILEEAPQTTDWRFPMSSAQAASLRNLLANRVTEQLAHTIGPVDVEVLLKAFSQGKIDDKVLNHFADSGMTFVKDYAYPLSIYASRAGRRDGDPSLKFFREPATAEGLMALVSEKEGNRERVRVVVNTLTVMARPMEAGGKLRGCPIQQYQLEMMKKFRDAIVKGKPVTIFNDTGTGKTTIASIANEVFSFDTPFVIHLAPFGSKTQDWDKLTSLDQLKSRPVGEPRHLWVTTADFKQLLSVAGEVPANMKETLFVLDEYDSEPYRIDERTRIQDKLYFDLGCKHILNMSATSSIEELTSQIERAEAKIGQLRGANPVSDNLLKLEKKRDELTVRKTALEGNIRKEFEREMTLKEAAATPDEQLDAISSEIGRIATEGGQSFLVELPHMTITDSSLAENAVEHLSRAAPRLPVTILFRDHEGTLFARMKEVGGEAQTIAYEQFHKIYGEKDQKPLVVCLYTTDSVGGDFEEFSNQALVRGQYIVYGDVIASSHSLYQNMRRERRGDGAHLNTPVSIYLGKDLRKQLPADDANAKKQLLKLAEDKNQGLEHQDEINRLSIKVARQKEQVVKEKIMGQDMPMMLGHLESSLQPHLDRLFASDHLLHLKQHFMDAALSELKGTAAKVLEKVQLKDNADIDEARKEILKEITHEFKIPLTDYFEGENDQMQTQVLDIRKQIKADDLTAFQKFMNTLYTKVKDSADTFFDAWTQFLRVTPSQALKILHAIRKDTPNVPMSSHLDTSKSFAPDFFVKAMLGDQTKNTVPFFKGLDRAVRIAHTHQAIKLEYQAVQKEMVGALKQTLSNMEKIDSSELTDVRYYDERLQARKQR